MFILTSAHSETSKSYKTGKVHKNFSFRSVIQKTTEMANSCGYKMVVYDLGTLGIGNPYNIKGEMFDEAGLYKDEPQKGYKSKALFKPEIVKKCFKEHNDLIVYLDADAQLCAPIDEIATDDYDIGVTLRDRFELDSEWHKQYFDIVKYVNAGVIFFNHTEATMKFIDRWEKVTYQVGNDQMALNQLTCQDDYPVVNSVTEINGVRIKYFPCKMYNYYYFNHGLEPNIKIMHFKGDVRHFYPFDWKKKLYCRTVIPTRSIASSFKNRLLS